ncbi:MAG: DUF1858 domain-containing protein [Dethiobacteria bacterium]|nr:DUF1858 domain-containing protein [Bacillota bacterium]MDW7729911.1 DUF1858 domain-containing protein [Bacillota bacterium]
MKEIDLTKNIYQLTEEDPELIDVLKELGFAGIAFPAVRKTLGKKMTLPTGCEKQKKDLDQVIRHLESLGYKISGRENCQYGGGNG